MPPQRVEHRPTFDLAAGAAAGEWISTGCDPQFEIGVPSAIGSRFTIAVNGFAGIAGLPLCPVLYVDTGAGYAESTAILLPGPDAGRLVASIVLPARPVRLRLDPALEPGLFTLASIDLDHSPGGPAAATDTRFDPPWLPAVPQDSRTTAPVRISVLMPVRDPVPVFLERAVQSVLEQTHRDLELCVVDDGSRDRRVGRWLSATAERDSRVRLAHHERSRGISAATNTALALATGDYIALVDHDDVLHPAALAKVAGRIAKRPATDYVYTNEDHIDADGRHFSPIVKPAWSPEYLASAMYTNHLSVYRAALVRELGGFRPAFDGAQDYDLALRVARRTRRVEHIPEVLYHWRAWAGSTASGGEAKPYAEARGRTAVVEYFRAAGRLAAIERGHRPGVHRARFAIDGEPLVSAIVHGAAAENVAAERVLRALAYRHLEILCVETEDPLALNAAAHRAHGDYLLWLDARAAVRTTDAVNELLMLAQQAEIGAVAPRICDRRGRVQEAGLPSDALLDGIAVPRDPSQVGIECRQRNVSVVSMACTMTPAALFRRLGGFDAQLHGALAAADYCLRLQREGYRIVFTPCVEVGLDVERSAPGPLAIDPRHGALFRRRWPAAVEQDPFFPRSMAHRSGAPVPAI